MSQNSDIAPAMMSPATAGKVFDGGCHCGAVRFRVTGPVGKILICHCHDCMRTAGLSWAGVDAALDRFDLVKDAGLNGITVRLLPSAVFAVIAAHPCSINFMPRHSSPLRPACLTNPINSKLPDRFMRQATRHGGPAI